MAQLRLSLVAIILISSVNIIGCIRPLQSNMRIVLFKATPSSINTDEETSLAWNVLGAKEVNISNGIGTVPASGNLSIRPNQTTTYTLIASDGTRSIAENITVAVSFTAPPPVAQPPIPMFTVDTDSSILLRYYGKEIKVNGTVANIDFVKPELFPAETWAYIFFYIEGLNPLQRYTSKCFRAVIKPADLNNFSAYTEWKDEIQYRTYYSGTGWNNKGWGTPAGQTVYSEPYTVRTEKKLGLLLNEAITIHGVLALDGGFPYGGTPVIYLNTSDQIEMSK